MRILKHLAQNIVEKTSEVLQLPVSITDHEGYIIGATDKSRIGLFHQPSLEVIKKNTMVNCKNEIEKKILPGVSVPIKFNHKVIGVLGIVGDPKQVEKYGQLVKNQVEMMCQEAFRKEMVELKEKMVEVFIHQISQFQTDQDYTHIHQYAKLLDFNFNKNHVCILIDTHTDTILNDTSLKNFQREALDFFSLIFCENKGDIASFINNYQLVIIKTLPFQETYPTLIDSLEEKLTKVNAFLDKKYHLSAYISIGDICQGVKGISESLANAQKAMNLGRRSQQNTQIFIYNERELMLRLLPRELTPDYQRKLQKTIAPLIEHDSYDVLAETFTAFCKYNMKLSEASRNLYVHRNTIIYRLEKIREITSLDTGNFEHCMLLYTAIQCYEENKVQNHIQSKANVQ